MILDNIETDDSMLQFQKLQDQTNIPQQQV